MKKSVTQLWITALTGILCLGVVFTYASQKNQDHQALAASPIYATVTPTTLVKADFGLTTTSNTAFTVTKDATAGANDTFVYTGTTNQTATGSTNPWFTLKSKAAERFTQAAQSGSTLNKWHLTSITIVYSKVTATTGQHNYVFINSIAMFDYVSVTNSTSLTNLDANQATATATYNYSDNITTFTIIPTYIVYISSISLTYTIDYGSC